MWQMWTAAHTPAQKHPLQPTTFCSTSVPGERTVECTRHQDPPSGEAEGVHLPSLCAGREGGGGDTAQHVLGGAHQVPH